MTTLTKTQIYATTDGATFKDRKDAEKAQKVIDRTARVGAVVIEGFTEDIVKAIATNGDALHAALTLPSGRAPRKPKAAA